MLALVACATAAVLTELPVLASASSSIPARRQAIVGGGSTAKHLVDAKSSDLLAATAVQQGQPCKHQQRASPAAVRLVGTCRMGRPSIVLAAAGCTEHSETALV